MDSPTDTSIKGMVEVHGTEFNIKAYSNEQAKVTLVRGELKIVTNADTKLLSARQAAVIDNRSKKIQAFTIRSKRASIVAWTEGYFSFENDSIGTIVKELERWYNKKITYTGTPSNMTPGLYMPRISKLTDILAVLEKNYNLTFEIENTIRPSIDK
jgi:ferric-dicitrate binding protein FerR (iron transport regulator)